MFYIKYHIVLYWKQLFNSHTDICGTSSEENQCLLLMSLNQYNTHGGLIVGPYVGELQRVEIININIYSGSTEGEFLLSLP